MKKALLFLPLLICIAGAHAQNTMVVVKDTSFTSADRGQTLQLLSVATSAYNPDCSLKTYAYAYVDLFTNQLKDQSQLVYEYYPDGTVFHKTSQQKFGTDTLYSNDTRETFTYTAAKAIATDLYENWNGTNWLPAYLITNTYDAAGRLIEVVNQSSDGFTPLVNISQALTVYDANGHIVKTENLNWDATLNAWIPTSETLFNYNASGYVATKSDKTWDTTFSAWTFTDSSTYFNNSKGLPDSVITQTSDTSYSKGYYTYNAAYLLFQFTNYNYEKDIKISGYRASYYHDTTNLANKDSTVNEIYQPAGNSFIVEFYTVYTKLYNTDNTLKAFIAVTNFPQFGLYSYTKNSYGYALCSDALPVTLIRFSGEQKNNNALLHWQTANEINAAYFSIQRSVDAVSFTTIGKVKASGNKSTTQDYTYTDANISMLHSPALYYRLATTDNDGSITYSKTVQLNIVAGKFSITISPNPFVNAIVVYVPVALANARLTISDVSGKIVYAAAPATLSGKITIDASRFASGMYIINIQTATEKDVFKIMKE